MKTSVKITTAAMLLALGMVLPFLTGQIQQIGSMLLPMHFPVFICGMVLGWKYGIVIGFILPLLRSVIFGMPPLYPVAIAMAFELAAYGAVSGFVFYRLNKINTAISVYTALITAMLAGRIVWAVAEIILLGFAGNSFTWKMFMTGAFLNAIPGILLQLVIIPAVVLILKRVGLTQDRHESR